MIPPMLMMLALSVAPQEVNSSAAWTSEPTEGSCNVRQTLPSPASGIRIGLTPGSLDAYVVFFDVPGSLSIPSLTLKYASIKLMPEGTYFGDGAAGPSGLTGERFVSIPVSDPSFLSAFVNSTSISITHTKLGELQAALHAPNEAAEILRTCAREKMQEWGIDSVAWNSLQRPPTPTSPTKTWVGPEDYPSNGSLYGIEGEAVVRLTVAVDGLITSCAGVNPSVPAVLNDAVCAAAKRHGKFNPALDSHSQPTSAPYVISAHFQILR